MKHIGIFFGSSSGKTESVAARIMQAINGRHPGIRAEMLDIFDSAAEEVQKFDILIFGIPTWGVGELQEDWVVFLEGLRALDLEGRQVALFGLGDQESYPGTFCDAMGRVYELLDQKGCVIRGSWQAGDYEFQASRALAGSGFVGLVLDEENQPELTDGRIDLWLRSIDLLK